VLSAHALQLRHVQAKSYQQILSFVITAVVIIVVVVIVIIVFNLIHRRPCV
jgi:ABC-type arginine/histidine transport system permease subunit